MSEEWILCLFINIANLLSVMVFLNINVSISKYLNFHLVNISFTLDEHYISCVKPVMCPSCTLDLDIRMDGRIDTKIDRWS